MIRLPDIPGVNPTAINAPQMNAKAAAAPALALGNVAQSISQAGEMFHGIAMQTQKLENARKESEARMGLATDYAALQIELQKEQDPAARIAKSSAFFSGYKGRMDSDEYPPAVRDSLLQHFDEFAGKGMINATADAAQLEGKRARQAFDNEIEQAPDLASATSAIDRYAATGDATPEEIARMKYQTGQKFEHQARVQQIHNDPRGWMEANDPNSPPPGYDPIKWRQIHDYAAGQARDLDVETSDSVLDGIVSGKLTDPKQIYDPEKNTGFAAELRPTDRQRLLDTLGRWNAEGAKAARYAPENIAKNVGEFYTRLQEWQPDEEGQDPAGVELRMLIEELPEGHPLAAKMRESMGARKGRLQGEMQSEITSKLDQGIDAINQAGERGDFGPLKAPAGLPVETSKAVKDGFLQDTRKMQALGFDEDQAQQILEAARKDPALGQAKFNELWEKRPQDSVNAAPFDIAVADAIRGENAFLQWTGDVPPEKTEEHQRAIRSKGDAILEYSKWIKANPNANETEIGAKMRELAGKSARIAPISGPVKPPPPRPGTETSMTIPKGGLKLSNYGYASDTTPDRYSAKGIGHSNNKLIPGESAAITKSLADRLGLAHGDKLKITTTKGDFTVFYHDTVPATDKRTGDLPETIDIYRPKDGSNGWGGRVTKVSKI